MVTQKERKAMAKPQKNYSAWDINATAFSSSWPPLRILEFFARYAVLAPSGHNTQPWLFLKDNKSLILKVNPERELPFSGGLAAEPYVSLGACLETMRLAAAGFGYALNIDYLLERKDMARVSLGNQIPADPSLLAAITSRSSNRSLYTDRVPDAQTMATVTTHDLTHVSYQLVSDRADIEYLAEKTLEATAEIMTEQEFRKELSKWVRNNITRQHDGMPGFAQGMPTPPSLLAKHVVRRFDISKTQAKLDAKRVLHSPVLAIICAKDDNPASYLEVGRLFASIGVRAVQAGVASSGIGAAAISPTTKQMLVKHFNLPSPPTALMRLGYATKAARHTPRWSVEQVSK
jgi:nitroreductase